MIPIGSNSTPFAWLVVLLGFSLAAFSAPPVAPGDRVTLVEEPSPGLPTCEEFYDKWNVPGAPPGLLAMAGLGREVIAAKDCIDKNNVPMACKHWQGLLAVVDKMGPPLDESRDDIEQLMREHECAESADPASSPGPDTAPDSQAGPDTDPVSGHGSGSDSQTSPDSPE
jgi:hypothetical protein